MLHAESQSADFFVVLARSDTEPMNCATMRSSAVKSSLTGCSLSTTLCIWAFGPIYSHCVVLRKFCARKWRGAIIRQMTAIFATATLGLLIPSTGMAGNGPTVTVNPDLQQAIMFLDGGEKISMNVLTQVFTFRAASGQSVSFTFAEVAQEITANPSEQQALIQQWSTEVSDPSNRFTITNTHEPTLSVISGPPNPPPGYFEIEGAPGIGGSNLPKSPVNGSFSSLQGGSTTPGPCSFASCSCKGGECWPSHGFPVEYGHDLLFD